MGEDGKIEVSRSLLERRNRLPGFVGPNNGRFKPTREHLDRAIDVVCGFEGWFDNEWFKLGEDAVLNIYRIHSAGVCAATIHPATIGEGGKMVINCLLWNHIVMFKAKKDTPIAQSAKRAKRKNGQ